jgi:hypothetical protein
LREKRKEKNKKTEKKKRKEKPFLFTQGSKSIYVMEE